MSEDFKKYICKTCGLIYDEELGDPDSGLAPGTRFEDIPDDWYCPLCLVSKSDFIPLDEAKAKSSPDGAPKRKASTHADVLIIAPVTPVGKPLKTFVKPCRTLKSACLLPVTEPSIRNRPCPWP